MDRQKFEELLQETLEEKSRPVSMSDLKKQEILDTVREQSRKEEIMMRFGFKKRVIVVAAAMCMFGTIAALAAGKIVGYRSSTMVNEVDYETFADLKKVEADAGISLKAVEKFDNGYQFEKGYKSNVEAMDGTGKVVSQFPEISLHYKKDDMLLTLNAEKEQNLGDEENPGTVAGEHKGIELWYKEDNYMFVPPSYEPSEEERKAEAAGELYISYGSSEVEHEVFHFMQWTDDGIHYLLMSSDENAPGQEEMAAMAKQIIDSEKQ